jgi:hypothetical protein
MTNKAEDEKDLVPILRALTETTSADDPYALDMSAHCPPTLQWTPGGNKTAKYVRIDLALKAAEDDVARALQHEADLAGSV